MPFGLSQGIGSLRYVEVAKTSLIQITTRCTAQGGIEDTPAEIMKLLNTLHNVRNKYNWIIHAATEDKVQFLSPESC